MGKTEAPEPSEVLDYIDLPDLALVDEVAKFFRVTGYTIKAWLRAGEAFPNAFKVSSSWRIPKEDALAYAKKLYGDREGERSSRTKIGKAAG
jgi:hypothetical protein